MVAIFFSLVLKANLKLTYLALVTHTCNPSYSGGRDQEDRRFEASLGQ
jgi:hypothetical protein